MTLRLSLYVWLTISCTVFNSSCNGLLSPFNQSNNTISDPRPDDTQSPSRKEQDEEKGPDSPDATNMPDKEMMTANPNQRAGVIYQGKVIKPSQQQQAQLDATLLSFYSLWKAKYIQQNPLCGAGTYFVATLGDVVGQDTLTVSEAIGFGMVILAQMAEFDQDAQTFFEGMLRFYQQHPSSKDARLMNWQVRSDCTSTPDSTAAPDGDMDVAYSLLLAAKQWPNQANAYRMQAMRILQALIESEIITQQDFVALWEGAHADVAFQGVTRSSDYIGHYFDVFAKASNNMRWLNVKNKGHQLIDIIQNNHSPQFGLISDFVLNAGGIPQQPSGKILEKEQDNAYFYNACRVPWRLAMSGIIDNDQESIRLTNRITKGLQLLAQGQCEGLKNGYTLEGTPLGTATDMAFVGPAAVGAMLDPNQQAWLDSLWQCMVSRPFDQTSYYGNTLKLLSMIVMTQHWQHPL